MNRRHLLLLLALLLLRAAAWADPPAARTLDELFPERSYLGKSARAMAWSQDGRYLAYLWNPFDDAGYDLWVYDTKESKALRLTSLETFRPFDRDIPGIATRYQQERDEREKRKSLGFSERNRLDIEDRKKREEEDRKRREQKKDPLLEYAGVAEIDWAKTRDELLFVYRGDIYRIQPGQSAPTRLTRTRDAESDVRWTRDDAGFTFRRGSGLYRVRFDRAEVRQLNPELPEQMALGSYWLSPDETKLVILTARRAGPPAKQVAYLTYRDRFAQARTTERDTGEDPVPDERFVFGYDLDDDPLQNPKNDGKPWEIFKLPVGEAGDIAIQEKPFSPDSHQFVFAAWKRDKRDLQVLVADFAQKKSRTVYRDTENGEHRTPSMADPFFSPDGKKICVLLDKSGYRHAWLIDPQTEGASPLTRGAFETYPIRFTPDGKQLLVRASKEDPSQMDLYRVSVASGEMERWTGIDGAWRGFALSEKADRFAALCNSWKRLTELYVGEKAITDSHAPEAKDRALRLTPERFSYPNRHGQTVQGYLLYPPGFARTQKRPLLVYVYGGPLGEGKQVNDGAFDRFGVYCAETLGYVYAVIDPRGTSGYGAVFGRANFEQPGVPQVEDLVDGVRFLLSRDNLDAAKVGIHGWSFGGFQTQMCLYTAPETFTLGIAGAGPTEWQNYNNWYVGGVIAAGKKPDELDAYSLTKRAKNLKGPLLLLHGLEDTNVLAQDTIKVYRELLKEGKGPLVELVVDPTGGHGLGGDIRTKDRFEIYAGFLERRWGRFTP